MSRVLALPDPQPPHAAVARHTLVLADEVSLAVLHQVERVAASEATVLIVGETGTGKELIARHVHTCSGRAGPFVAVNCGAFAENLIDAELFGHEAGAYTGAGASRAGWFEAAQGGTLFLDEIGDLPQPLQVKLLRVLQERQVVRLGSRKAVDVNVRLVAATNVDLAQAVEDGRFRRDLYYRLNIATLHLPPLSQRPADILALAGHFIARYSHRLGLSGVSLSAQARAALLAHPWPGNIRELENVIHYALIVGHGRSIEVEALNLQAPHGGAAPPDEQPVVGRDSAALPLDLHGLDLLRRGLRGLFEVGGSGLYAAIERDVVQVAYEFCHRNQVHTAELLGISRNVLRAQLKRFGLLPERARQGSDMQGAPLAAIHFTTTDPADASDGQPTGETSWAA